MQEFSTGLCEWHGGRHLYWNRLCVSEYHKPWWGSKQVRAQKNPCFTGVIGFALSERMFTLAQNWIKVINDPKTGMLHLAKVMFVHRYNFGSLHTISFLCAAVKLWYVFVRVNRVFLAGHSAGAHLAACALVKQAQKEVFEDATKLSWRSHELKAFFAISGG
jgi:hypothetical protein